MTLSKKDSKPYTKAFAITPHDSNAIDPKPDAYYVGSGNYTDAHTTTDFANPKVWYRGGEQTTMGGAVTSWSNKVNSRESTMTGSSIVDTDGDASTNYIDYLTFNAATDYLKTTDTDTNYDIGTGEFEMMAVVRFADNGNNWQHIASRDAGASNWGWLRRSDAASSNEGKINFSIIGSDPMSATTVAYDTWYILGVSRDSSNVIQLYRDGATDGASATNGQDLNDSTGDPLVLGAKDNGSGTLVQSLLGDMLEFILWETKLSDKARADCVKYLQDRYFNDQVASLQRREGDTIATVYPKVGTVIEDSPEIIMSTNIQAGNIVGLTKD